jgi:hypothetical protein
MTFADYMAFLKSQRWWLVPRFLPGSDSFCGTLVCSLFVSQIWISGEHTILIIQLFNSSLDKKKRVNYLSLTLIALIGELDFTKN